MKRFLIAATLAAATITTPTLAADVGVSISIGQPGFYGQLNIGGFPQPRVMYRQPVVVEQVPMSRPPIYLHVPPGHSRHWKKHCHEYNACGERVFFVQESWYNREYVPRYQEQHRDRGNDRRDDHRERHGNGRQDKDRGHGREH